METVTNILVPIDFSVSSRNAYRYAKTLSKTLNAKLTVVHVKEHSIMVSDVEIAPLPFDNEPRLVKDIEEFITKEDAVMNTPTVKNEVNIQILRGDPVSVLTRLSENKKTNLIVIGTTGFSDVLTKIFGSTSVKLSNQAHCPVILVPKDAKWQPIKQIMYASNYDSMTAKAVEKITSFALNIEATIHFINVKNFDPMLETKQKEMNLNGLFESVDPNLHYENRTIYGNNTLEELKTYSEENNINLMAFVSKHRNFWENLIHKSITENMTLSTITPIMVIHLDDK